MLIVKVGEGRVEDGRWIAIYVRTLGVCYTVSRKMNSFFNGVFRLCRLYLNRGPAADSPPLIGRQNCT
jgi:hypothetical protein